MREQLEDGWILWTACPVTEDTEVEAVTRDGDVLVGEAGWFVWGQTGGSGDIIKYRTVKEVTHD